MIAVLASLLAGVSAPSAEPYLMAECPAAIRNEPTLDARLAPDATFRVEVRPIGWQRDKTLYLLTGLETATLKSGARLKTVLGGCENYSNSYAFELKDRTPLRDGRYWLVTAAQLMGEVEAVSAKPPVEFASLRKSLLAAAHRHPKHDFSAGEFLSGEGRQLLQYSYRIQVERTKTGTILTLDYWVPL